MMFDDTIAAISTPPGRGGISVIRISGSDAVDIADKVFKNEYGKTIKNAKTHTITHGFAVDKDGTVIDEVLCSVMLAPRSYTREDTVEISCHGGLVSTKNTLSAILTAGARLSEPGEFTKRAFLNGRMDLTEAEAVIDIINAGTDTAHTLSVHQLKGRVSEAIAQVREKLLTLTAHLQVLIDFADEDLEPLSDSEYLDSLKDCLNRIDTLISSFERGRIVREGVNTVIAGKPNVGKSSLLNLICGDERAIVTDIEGTTRDTISENVCLGSVMLSLSDTAGIRETDDVVEKIGVDRARNVLNDAELVLLMLDAAKPLEDSDREIMESVKQKKVIVLVNKAEKGIAFDKSEIDFGNVIDFSVKTGMGLTELEDTVSRMFSVGEIGTDDSAIITNIRHRDALQKAREALYSAVSAIDMGIEANMTFIDIENAITHLGEITGQTVAEEIVDKIFHSFCVGK